MFELLFKYPLAVFAQGELLFESPWSRWLLVGLIVAAAAALALSIAVRARRASMRGLGTARLAVLWLLESALVAVLLVLLWEPAIAITELKPRQNIVAVLIDDSRSMARTDDGVSRAQQVAAALSSRTFAQLARDYQLRLYRFDTELQRIDSPAQLGPPAAPATHIGASLKQLAAETSELPLGAVILLSDGGDNAGGIAHEAIDSLVARHVPVYTVGFGAERATRDVELADVTLAPRALAGSRLEATVRFHQSGLRGRKSQLSVRDGAKVLVSREVTLGADERLQSETLVFNVGAAGNKVLQFSLEPLPGETNRDNNTLTRLVSVESEPRRILYFEGEPRWEYKFIRRAAGDDPLLQLVSMLRTTENKIYRQGISDPKELAEGFPSRAEELFGFQALIIGSVDAGYFTPAQQDLIRAFVDRRGGGLLLLGGRQSLADGVWGGSRVADLLPVVLPEAHDTFHREPATVSLTAAGADSAICRLVDDPAENQARWRKLPYLMDYQDPGHPKPAALVLAEMHPGQNGSARGLPLLVTQNYGRGRTAVLATGGTWRWQMSLPLGDKTHELFWQQLLRWLAADTRERVVAAAAQPTLLDEAHAQLTAEVRDLNYLPAADAQVTAHIIGPAGDTARVELAPVPNAPGRFQAPWAAESPGVYVMEVSAQRGAQDLGRGVAAFRRLDGVAESFHTEQNRELLEGLARSTGGRYLRPDELGTIERSVPYSQAGITLRQTRELWNMPIVFLLLLALRGSEWLLRRKWGVV